LTTQVTSIQGKKGTKGGSDDSKSRPKSASSDGSDAAKVKTETEEILDSILPPREWEDNGQLWRQSVSATPATRLDVINLQVGLIPC
jgi:dynein light intermediate chain